MRILFTFFASLLFICNAYSQINIDTASFVKNNKQLYSVVVSQQNKIIYQQFFNGKNDQDIFNDQSLTKSVCSLLVGIAIGRLHVVKSIQQKSLTFL